MLEKIKEWITSNKLKTILLFFTGAFFCLAVIFSQLNVLPISNIGDLIFCLVLIFALALYRPGWAFLFFVGAAALENISLTTPEIGLTLRVYQALGALIIAAIALRWAFKKSALAFLRLEKLDYWILIFLGGSLLSALFSPVRGASLKMILIIFSFVALYFLTRAYVQDLIDFKKIMPFFLVTSAGVVAYGILQNIFFIRGFSFHGEVMPGRPNATFTEPDWLGIYLVFLLAAVYALIYYLNKATNNAEAPIFNFQFSIFNKFSINKFQIFKLFLYLFIIPIYILLLLTVSRSAWIGAGFITLVFLKAILTDFSWHLRDWRWKSFLQQTIFILCSGAASLLIVYSFNLTNFQLFNRAASTGGLQKITIACQGENYPDSGRQYNALPQIIGHVSELEEYGCRHINLEDINKEKAAGNTVREISRPDPNVDIRGQIFKKSWEEIKKRPILGIGYGAIPVILGQDERGENLNSSNIFLEVWLGSGLIGLLTLALIWFSAFGVFAKHFWRAESQAEKAWALFILLGSLALLIPNLFNAGIFLMILWLFWGILPVKFLSHTNSDKVL